MPSGITLGTFEDEELLKYQTMNALVDAIQARFIAGLGSADISWPLTAEGNLSMSNYFITGGKKIWNFVNAESYDTLSDAISAAGGGVVLIPPNYTQTTSGGEILNSSGATIIGSGPSSVIKFTGSPSADMITASGGTKMSLCNLTLDGNSNAGHSGLVISGAADFIIDHVRFYNFDEAALLIGSSANRVIVSNCWFAGGHAEHIKVTGCPVLNISNIISSDSGADGILIDSASDTISSILSNIRISGSAGVGLHVVGNVAPGTTSNNDFTGSNIVVISNTGGNGITLGTASGSLQRVSLTGGRVYGSSAGGILVNASAGSINGVTVDNPATFCVDLDVSQKVSVSDCVLLSGTIGVDGSDVTDECSAKIYTIEGCTADIAFGPKLVQSGNTGVVGPGDVNHYANVTPYVVPSGTSSGCDITIPANMLSLGSVIRFVAQIDTSGVSVPAGSGAYVHFDGNNIGEASLTYAGNEAVIEGTIVFDSAATAKSCYTGIVEDSAIKAGRISVTGLDLTKDNIVNVQATASATYDATVDALFLEIGRAKVVT